MFFLGVYRISHRDPKEILKEIEDKEHKLQNLVQNLKTYVND